MRAAPPYSGYMHRYPQIALGYSLERLMFVVHLCYFNEGCKVVASNVLHNTVRVSLYAYFDLLLICVADASPHFLVTYCGCRVSGMLWAGDMCSSSAMTQMRVSKCA